MCQETALSHECAKQSPICFGCGNFKEKQLIVCWMCYQYREDVTPFKHYDGTLTEWVKMVRARGPNLRNLRRIEFYQTPSGAAEIVAEEGARAIIRQLTGRGTVDGSIRELLRDLTGGFICWQEVKKP